MVNPVLNGERVEYLRARATAAPRALLSAWPRSQKELPRVDLEVTWIKFSTLNHRTKAEQIRSAHTSGNARLFTDDPLGQAAQIAQYEILRSQESFEDLRSDLRERRQQEPAVVTAEGVLINGNRRGAALRSLYEEDGWLDGRYISCLVLPEDATADEIVGLETELQIARDFKEEYSWVNESMLIEELYQRDGRNFDRVAKRMHRSPQDVRSQYEKLQHLNQLVDLSAGAYLHVDFIDNQSAFDELNKHIKSKPREEAESVRAAYFLGTLTGVEYRELRHLRRPDASRLIEKEFHADPALSPLLKLARDRADGPPHNDPLDDLFGKPAAMDGDVNGLLRMLATKRPEQVLKLADGSEMTVRDAHQSIRSKILAAANEANEDSRDQKAIEAPINRLLIAMEYIDKARASLDRARSYPEWDENTWRAKVRELKTKIAILGDVD